MRLKKIEICGFKSFADRVTVKFDKGVTSIVGPNGCGKSNIADALRWVMGEQSAKSVRGDRMYDVIFAGSDKRKPLAFAEVILVLTEINGALPIDFEEVEIKRRLTRSGESEYSLNGHKVRLKDIQNLLWDTGSAFAQIGQGQVDRMVTLKPSERRYFFDEAAGISRFRQRRKEAKSKLDRTEENVKRLGDIHREVDKQKKVLEKQSHEARVFKDQKQRLEFLDKAVILEKWRRLQEGKENLKVKQQALLSKEEEYKELLLEKSKGKEGTLLDLKKVQARLAEHQETFYRLKGERDVLQMELQTAKDRTKEMGEQKGVLESELKALIRQKEKEARENKEKATSLEKVKKKLEAASENYQLTKETLGTFKEDLDRLQETQKQTQKEYLQAVQEESRYQSQLKEWQVKIEATQSQVVSLKKKEEELKSKELSLLEDEKMRRDKVNTFSRQIEAQKILQAKLQVSVEDLTKSLDTLEKEQRNHHKLLTQKQARFQTLESLKKELEGFSKGTKLLLKESVKPESPLYGKIKGFYELFSPKKGAEKALAVALYRYLQTLVVETKEHEKLLWGEAKRLGIKDCSILCLEDVMGHKASEEKSLLSKVEDSTLAQHFLHDVYYGDCFSSLQVGECIDENGYFRDHRGVVFYSSKGEHNVFQRESELKELKKEITKLQLEQEDLEKEFVAKKSLRREQQEEKALVDKELRKLEMSHVEANFTLQTLIKQREGFIEDRERLDSEQEALSKYSEDLQLKTIELQKTYTGTKGTIQNYEKQSGSLEKQLERKLEKFRVDQVALEAKEQTFRHLKEEYQAIEHSINIFVVKEQENLRQQEKIRTSLATRQESNVEIKEKITLSKEKLDELRLKVQEVSALQRQEESFEKKLKQALGHSEKDITGVMEKRSALEKELHAIDIQFAEGKTSREAILHDLDERYQLSFEELLSQAPALDKKLEEAEKELKQLRQKVEKSTNINLAAIDEYEEVKLRFDELDLQMKDLQGAKSELENIIKDLDEKSRTVFKETFDKVRDCFKRNFSILFSGGEADLKLVDSSDVLEAGVDISAKPPGKQMRSITLLSGGEKCMTAIALLFALFEAKAAPFCMLDEIDAPLDDSNVSRFVNLVREFTERTQFIIITHNKTTMAAADRLYGISMQEKGVSRLLTMSFNKDEKKSVDYGLVNK